MASKYNLKLSILSLLTNSYNKTKKKPLKNGQFGSLRCKRTKTQLLTLFITSEKPVQVSVSTGLQ